MTSTLQQKSQNLRFPLSVLQRFPEACFLCFLSEEQNHHEKRAKQRLQTLWEHRTVQCSRVCFREFRDAIEVRIVDGRRVTVHGRGLVGQLELTTCERRPDKARWRCATCALQTPFYRHLIHACVSTLEDVRMCADKTVCHETVHALCAEKMCVRQQSVCTHMKYAGRMIYFKVIDSGVAVSAAPRTSAFCRFNHGRQLPLRFATGHTPTYPGHRTVPLHLRGGESVLFCRRHFPSPTFTPLAPSTLRTCQAGARLLL